MIWSQFGVENKKRDTKVQQGNKIIKDNEQKKERVTSMIGHS